MTRTRVVRAVAVGLWIAAMALVAGRVGVRVMDHLAQTVMPDRVFTDIKLGLGLFSGIVVASLGSYLAVRRPGNPIGWLFLVAAVGSRLGNLATEYTRFVFESEGYLVIGGTEVVPPGARAAEWIGMSVQAVPFACVFVFALLLFPNGRLPSRRWRPVAAICAVAVGLVFVALAFAPWEINNRPNPLGIGVLSLLEATLSIIGRQQSLVVLLLYAATILAASALIVRYRHAQGDERHQIKWFAFAGAITSLWVLAYVVLHYTNIAQSPIATHATGLLNPIMYLMVPGAAALAVFKYRLYDIDFIIRRTIVFGLLVAFIVAVYAGAVVAIGSIIGGRRAGFVSTVVAMGLVATGFQPVRLRSQQWANRVVFGERSPPDEVLRRLSDRMADPLPVEDVLPTMAEAIARAVDAEAARVSVSLPNEEERTAFWPAGELPAPSRSAPVPVWRTEVRHAGESVGAFELFKRRGDTVTRSDERLLAALASQAGAALWNVMLTEELRRRVEELRAHTADLEASRHRLLAAQIRTRRRVEREIAERIEPQLAGVRSRVAEARNALRSSRTSEVDHLISEAGARANEVLDELREIARGVFPRLLIDKGVVAALEAHSRKTTVPLEVVAPDEVRALRFTRSAESAIYFCCIEAVRCVEHLNRDVRVVLGGDDEAVEFAVEIHGGDPPRIPSDTHRDMADRVEAVGGSLIADEAGAVVAGRVPTQPDVAFLQASASRSGVSADFGT